MSDESVLTGAAAVAELEKLASEQNGTTQKGVDTAVSDPTPVDVVELRPVELPIGWSFAEIKMRHLLAFFDEVDLNEKSRSHHHFSAKVVKGAITAGWFSSPPGVQPDIVYDMDQHDADAIRTAVINHYVNKRDVKKK